MTLHIQRLPVIKARTGLSRSTIYLRISQGMFPRPINLGGRAVGWLEEEIDQWLSEQVRSSRRTEPVSAAEPEVASAQRAGGDSK